MLNIRTIDPEINAFVIRVIRELTVEAFIFDEPPNVANEDNLIDNLGFSSLLLARLVVELCSQIGTNPFETLCHISEIRTVGDMAHAFTLAQETRAPQLA